MIEKSLAQPTRTNTDDVRRSRGVAIATNHFQEIRKFSPGCYTVPATKPSEAYLVSVWPASQCTCPDQQIRLKGTGQHCKHIHAVRYLVKKSFVCEGCGERFWNSDYHRVEESLTYFEGDELCEGCFLAAGCQ